MCNRLLGCIGCGGVVSHKMEGRPNVARAVNLSLDKAVLVGITPSRLVTDGPPEHRSVRSHTMILVKFRPVPEVEVAWL
jgi:hypothetical protein